MLSLHFYFFFNAKTCLILFPWCIYHLKTLTFQIQNDTFRKKNASVVAFFRLSALQSCAISTSFFSIYFCIYRLTRKELALCWLFFQLPDCVSALNERVRFVEMNGKLCIFRKGYFCQRQILCFASLWLSYSADDICQSSSLPCFRSPGSNIYCFNIPYSLLSFGGVVHSPCLCPPISCNPCWQGGRSPSC